MSEITPSVGRQVWYYENDTQPEPWAATVIKVNAPSYQATPFTPITVLAISPEGEQFIIPDLPCSPVAAPYPHYRWMPYQKAQAAKDQSVYHGTAEPSPEAVKLSDALYYRRT